MGNVYGLHLYNAIDGRTVNAPQMMTMNPMAMAEYLINWLESGYEAVVSCPSKMLGVKPSLADFLVHTHEELLRSSGRNLYLTELAQSLTSL